MPSRSPIARLIDATPMRCTVCQQPAGTCQCWEDCSCGYSTRRYTPCANPDTTDCSTKLKYGTPAQQALWFEQLGRLAASEVLAHIDFMYPRMWDGVSKQSARTSLRHVIWRAVAQALRVDRNTHETD